MAENCRVCVNNNTLDVKRLELKYRVAHDGLDAILTAFESRIAPKQVDGTAHSYRVSTYLDTLDRRFSRAELARCQPSIKLRLREYFGLDSRDPPGGSERCFVEVKKRQGDAVEKYRFATYRNMVESMVHREGTFPVIEDAQQAFETFSRIRGDAPVSPLFIVRYRRYTLEDEAGTLRVTFDSDISYHVPTEAAMTIPYLGMGRLSPPILTDAGTILEIKSVGAPPDWATAIASSLSPSRYSKFGSGVRALDALGMLASFSRG